MLYTGTSTGDTLVGSTGDDTFSPGTGADNVSGDLGSDLLLVDYSSLSGNYAAIRMQISTSASGGYDGFVYDTGGNTIQFSSIEYIQILGGSENDSLFGFNLADQLDGGAGDDTINGNAGDDVLIASSGIDSVTGGDGNDILKVNYSTSSASVTSTTGGFSNGTDQVSYSTIERVSVTGGTGDDTIVGLDLGDTLIGGGGADSLDGGLGVDLLAGNSGDDVYFVSDALDVISEFGGQGTDSAYSPVSYTLGGYIENLTLTGTGNVYATGNTSDNILTGNSGDNRLNGDSGADSMTGGAGNDTYIVNLSDVVTEASGQGVDVVNSSVSYTLTSHVENLTLTTNGDIYAFGNTLGNQLTGNSGANKLDGGAGSDSMTGGGGDDTYFVDASTDVITEAGGGGIDVVNSSVSWILGSNLEKLNLNGTSVINATGNTLNNSLTGNTAANQLDGGAGIDTMTGGAGYDSYTVDASTDVVTEASGGGIDLVSASASFVLGANLENLKLIGTGAINATGNTLNNTLTGNTAANRLTGDAGNDTMTGGSGDDTYVVDVLTDVVTEFGGGGIDSVNSPVSWTLGSNLEKLALSGTAAINATGNPLNNVLTGNIGANTLNGAAGADSMTGGAGNDTYVVDSASDTVTEAGGGGVDSVNSSVAFTLGANLEILTLAGTTAINATGNSLNNTLTGNAAANTLDGVNASSGLGQKDTLTGGGGADTFTLGTASGRLYDDGIVASAGANDFALITDFTSADRLFLKGSLADYVMGTSPVPGITGQSIFFDADSSGTKTANDELIAIVQSGITVNLSTQAIFTP